MNMRHTDSPMAMVAQLRRSGLSNEEIAARLRTQGPAAPVRAVPRARPSSSGGSGGNPPRRPRRKVATAGAMRRTDSVGSLLAGLTAEQREYLVKSAAAAHVSLTDYVARMLETKAKQKAKTKDKVARPDDDKEEEEEERDEEEEEEGDDDDDDDPEDPDKDGDDDDDDDDEEEETEEELQSAKLNRLLWGRTGPRSLKKAKKELKAAKAAAVAAGRA